ncbi:MULTISPECIES: hypothetical protein [unclassified Psychrobacter]|uniref:hypothetical protein n=1 Tax=unclassified Psychrobacter TaxID=196806 RepID=UPI0018F4E183|nr:MULTISPECIES: hypothetical protein [unclassified Psychrobacter]
MIDPFANNHQSMQVGNLVIENQTDKVTIYGDIDITRDEAGREAIEALHQLTSAILNALDTQNLDAPSNDNNDRSDTTIANPFL